MNWQQISVSIDNTHFLFEGNPLFGKRFIEVKKFHSPGIAPVKDETGSYHIDILGNPLYAERYKRVFGFYCNRAAVENDGKWFHLNELGKLSYRFSFSWTGNYQENLCPVRDKNNNYFHIDPEGHKIYTHTFRYCGDFKDGIACIKSANGLFRHIDNKGNFLNNREFLDLGIFHKNYAPAMDKDGWHHIDKTGCEVYVQRYLTIEPFYNGFALVTKLDGSKLLIDEKGTIVLKI